MTSVDGPGQRFSRSVAVVIGIDEYTEGVPPLRSAVADATAIAGALERDHGFELRCLFDRDAGLSGLLRVLRTDLPAHWPSSCMAVPSLTPTRSRRGVRRSSSGCATIAARRGWSSSISSRS